jgi:three-Cys-motif partner protein
LGLQFDEIGYWSELKLEIVKKYAKAYSTILASQAGLHHVYVDGFSGAGTHISRATGEFVKGSPLNALEVQPPFEEYFLVDLDGDKVSALRAAVGLQPNVYIVHGDCNEVLLQQVLPRIRYEDFRRGLCLLDPYGLHLDWDVIRAAGEMKTIDLFLNFPIMDMNRNALWREPEKVGPEQVARMTAFWGDESWRLVVYKPAAQLGLFAAPRLEKQENEEVADAFRRRLRDVAGFAEVPEPLPMRNSKGAVVYYLFFASQRPVALKIIKDIFDDYRERKS